MAKFKETLPEEFLFQVYLIISNLDHVRESPLLSNQLELRGRLKAFSDELKTEFEFSSPRKL